MSTKREIPNPYDNNLDSYLEEFEPPQEIAIRMYVVICGNGNVVNRTDDDYWYHPSEVTLDIFKEVLSEHCPELDKWQVKLSWKEFKRIFKESDVKPQTLDEFREEHSKHSLEDIEEMKFIYEVEIIPTLVENLEFKREDFDYLKRKRNELEIIYELINENDEERF